MGNGGYCTHERDKEAKTPKKQGDVLLKSGHRVKSESPTFLVSAPANESSANKRATCSPFFHENL